jgi:hypothetical protein
MGLEDQQAPRSMICGMVFAGQEPCYVPMKCRMCMSNRNATRRTFPVILLLLAFFTLPGEVIAESEIEHVVDVHQVGRKLVAIRADRPNRTIELRLKEEALWSGSFGKLGVAVTTHRLLVVSEAASSWQEKALRLRENVDSKAHLSSNIALANTGDRIVGYDAVAETFLEWDYPIEEDVRQIVVERDVAVVVLEREVLGHASDSAGFVPIRLGQDERLVSVTAKTQSAAVVTIERILSFTSSKKRWEEESVSHGR